MTISSRSINEPPANLKRGAKHYTGKASVLERQPHIYEQVYPWIWQSTQVTTGDGESIRVPSGLKRMREQFERAHKTGGSVWFIGNGGSAAIASHMAVDWTKNGGIRSRAMNDAPTLTCLANDFGYDQVFAKGLEQHATKRDAVVIISTSGRLLNIVAASGVARTLGCFIATLSGMNPNNVLRQRGDVNFYIPCVDYGIVETAHLILLHSVIER